MEWKNTYEKNDFDNELLKTTFNGKAELTIGPDGKITGEIGNGWE